MGGILFFVLHLALLLFTDSVNCTTPPAPETKTENYSVYFCLCILLVAQESHCHPCLWEVALL